MEPFVLKSAKTTLLAQTKPCTLQATLVESAVPSSMVFGVVRVLGTPSPHRERLVELINETLERFAQTMTEDMNAPRRFEQILQTLNQEISNRKETSSHIPFSDFQAVVGLVWQGQLFLSGVGNVAALFLHRKSKKRYTVYDLDMQFSDGEQDWEKPFITVLDGEVNPGDVLYVATRVSAREVSAAQLQDILVTLPPSGALKRVTQYLGVDTNYAAVCFHAHIDETSGPRATNPITSLSMLGETKSETESLLTDQRPEFSKILHRLSAPLLQKLSAPGTRGAKSSFLRLLRLLIQVLIAILTLLIKFAKILVAYTGRGLSFVLKMTRDKEKRDELQSHILGIKKMIRDTYVSLTPRARFGAVAGAICLIALIGTISLVRSRHLRSTEQEAFDTIADHIEEKVNAAEASLIYDNSEQARILLGEATALLESLPRNHKAFENEAQALEASIHLLSLQLQKMTEISPQILAELTDSSGDSFQSALVVNGTIFAFTSAGDVYSYSSLQESFEKQSVTYGSIGVPAAGTSDEDAWLFIDADKQLGRFDAERVTLNPVVSGLDDLSTVEDIFLYNDNVYALTAAGEQVLKMRPQGDNYEAGTSWIGSRTTSLSDARALAIDGDIYILTTTDVIKFTSGREETWETETIEPALNKPTDIWTSFGNDFLYILDPSQTRVVVLNKNGDLVTQYTNEVLADARAMIIDESGRTIKILTGSSLLSWPMTHF